VAFRSEVEGIGGEGDDFEKMEESVESFDLSDDESSDYEHMLHPNEEKPQDEASVTQAHHQRRYRGCAKYLHRFDELIMKPIFIHKYEKHMEKKSTDFFELFMKQGQEIEKEFKKANPSHDHGFKMVHKAPKNDDNYLSFEDDLNSQKNKSTTGYSQISRQFTRTRIRLSKIDKSAVG
jgi:hypothetical protein